MLRARAEREREERRELLRGPPTPSNGFCAKKPKRGATGTLTADGAQLADYHPPNVVVCARFTLAEESKNFHTYAEVYTIV